MNTRQATPRARGWANRCVASALCAAIALPAPAWAQSANTRFKGEPVTLNFVNAEIDAVSRAMAAILKQQFMVDPRVKGNITLYSEQPLSPREAYLNYLAALRGLGFTVVESGGLFKVVPEADAKLQASTVAVGGTAIRGDQVITQIFKLNHENANNLVPVLRPLISPNNTINANPGNNSLVVTDYADNLGRIAKIIAAMDTPASGDVEIIQLKHAVASDIALLVQRLTDSGGGAAGAAAAGAAGGSLNTATVLADARSNSLMVRAPNPARLASIRALVAKLDKPVDGAGGAAGNIWVVYLKNADAVKLASVIRAAYGATGGGGSPSGSSGSGGAMAAAANTANNTSGASAQATAPVSASAAPSTGGFIQADPASNSLIITAPEPMYRQLRAMIDQLDSRRAQVYIESMIVEVEDNNDANFGFQWQGVLGNKGDANLIGFGTNFNTANTAGTGGTNIVDGTVALRNLATTTTSIVGQGFNIGLAHNYGGKYALAAIAQMMQKTSNLNIISTPNLITLDNEEAKIVVGENVPFITGQYTNTGTSTSNPFQTIERKDVGITLRIKPQVSENGTVRMTIFQESSSVKSTDTSGPTTRKRSIESNVLVEDGAVLVLGGLIEDRFEDSKFKVPLLGDLPLIGGLFRSESRSKKRTNLMVFLRPVVMRDAESSTRLSLDRYDLIRNDQQNVQPRQSAFLPINEAPVLPQRLRPEDSAATRATTPASAASAAAGR